MSIKYINCFGTSFTQGGGFEYWRQNGIRIAYQGLGSMIGQSHYDFSWPGQLQKYLGDDYQVKNYGKCGFGNERIYRKAHDIINSLHFDHKEHIFLFEFSDVGRKEIYHAELDKYLICNYVFNSDDGEKIIQENPNEARLHQQLSVAYDYWFETKQQEMILDNDLGCFRDYVKKTTTLKNTISTLSRNVEMFLSYLELNKIQYIIVQKPFTFQLFNWNKWFEHRCLKKGILNYLANGVMTINDETNPRKHTDGTEMWEYDGIDDFHGGYSWAVHVSYKIFKEINKRYFESKLDSKWIGPTYEEVKQKIDGNFAAYEDLKSNNKAFNKEFLNRVGSPQKGLPDGKSLF